MNEDIGSNIKRIRTAKGLRQVDLAGILGTSQQNLAQYESNKRKPKREQLEKIAAALDVDVNDLIPNSPKKKLIFNAQPGLDALDKALRMQRKAPTYSELLDQQELNLIVNYKLLNTKGRDKLLDYSELLLKDPRLFQASQASFTDLQAAHARTDIEPTPEGQAHDDAIMDDDSEWE